MTPCYMFDLDGTLCDITHRLHHIQKEPKDWDSFFAACGDDVPILHIGKLICDLLESDTSYVIFVSGRSDQVRAETERWLKKYFGFSFISRIYMRKAGDHRPDHIIKMELLEQILADGFEPIMVFDDRSTVVRAWREHGIPCAQVAEGDF